MWPDRGTTRLVSVLQWRNLASPRKVALALLLPAGYLVLFTSIGRWTTTAAEHRTRAVAVDGRDERTYPKALRLTVERVADPVQAVRDGDQQVAIIERRGSDTLYYQPDRPSSLEAFARVRLAALPRSAGSPVTVDVVTVSDDDYARRLDLGANIVLALMILIGNTLGAAGNTIADDKLRGGFEALLVQPVKRARFAAGICVGMIPSVATRMFGGLVVVVAVASVPGVSSGLGAAPLGDFVTRLLVALVALTLAVVGAVTLFVAATGRAGRLRTITTSIVMITFLAGFVLSRDAATTASGVRALTPIVGPELLVRDGLVGRGSPVDAAVVLIAGAAWCVVSVLISARFFAREMQVLRK